MLLPLSVWAATANIVAEAVKPQGALRCACCWNLAAHSSLVCAAKGSGVLHTFDFESSRLRQCCCYGGSDNAGVMQGGQVCDIEGTAPPHSADARLRVTPATQLEIVRTDSKGLEPADV